MARLKPTGRVKPPFDGIPVKSGNDANVAALGEMWQGGGKGYSDLVMVTLGTGVGGGVILDQKIIAGKHGLGGEIGHIHVRDDEWEHCNCSVQHILSTYIIPKFTKGRRLVRFCHGPSGFSCNSSCGTYLL